MVKILNLVRFFTSSSLIIMFSIAGVAPARSEMIQLGGRLPAEPLVMGGRSGGGVNSKDCGFITRRPQHVLSVNQRINYMKLTVQAEGGEPTLLIDGPDGRFCIFGDRSSGENPEISGLWLRGRYRIFVGDRTGNRHRFRLELSQEQ